MRSSSTCRSRARGRLPAWPVAVAIGVFVLQTAHAMDPNRDVSQYIRDEWGSEQGLPGGPVYAITQTPDGYLWIGTEKGLVRYDGVTFRLVPTTVPGQPAIRSVLGLTADAGGSLWIRGAGPTLSRYRDGAFSPVASDPSPPDALVTAMVRGRDGRLLLSSMGSGTIRESRGRFETLALPAALPRSVVISISDTPSGDVWLGTRDAGLVSIRGAQVSQIVAGLPDRKINSLLPGENQELWIGTDKGVVRWNGTGITASGVPAALASVQALSMIRDRGSNIWIGTASGELLRVTAGAVSALGARAGQPRGAVTALFEDRDGNLWVGSARGLERIRDSYLFGRREIVIPARETDRRGTLNRDCPRGHPTVTVPGAWVAVSAYNRRGSSAVHRSSDETLTATPPMTAFAIPPPVEPMLAKVADVLPSGDGFLYEPKWDGFRAIVFSSATDVYIQSRDLRPLDRYFPDLHAIFRARLPAGCVIDGEIVIATSKGLDFGALQLRLHPAASRVAKLAEATPAAFVGFDLLAAEGVDLRTRPQSERRSRLEVLLGEIAPPIYLTPMTRDRALAAEWLEHFEGAGLDGVIAKPVRGIYEPGKRAMIKVKHARTADCVVAGFRWHKSGEGIVGSLLLGLYDAKGTLHHVGVTSAFTMAARKQLASLLAPLREQALEGHPWREWADASGRGMGRMPGAQSRWSAGKDLSWEPVRIERVCEVKYDHLQGDRFRHAAVFARWRPDRQPADCRYDQLEVTAPYELERVFGAARRQG